jgi:hypothetical protein
MTLITVTVVGLLAVMSPGPDFIIVTRNSLLYSKRAAYLPRSELSLETFGGSPRRSSAFLMSWRNPSPSSAPLSFWARSTSYTLG